MRISAQNYLFLLKVWSGSMQRLWHREHRSGLKVPTNLEYKPERGHHLIGYSFKKRKEIAKEGFKAGCTGAQVNQMQEIWKVYDRKQLVARLDVICPGHGYRAYSHKIPMMILWVQNENIRNNREVMRKIRSYSHSQMYHCPPERKRRQKRRRRKRRRRRR